jgi:hypothetical protein
MNVGVGSLANTAGSLASAFFWALDALPPAAAPHQHITTTSVRPPSLAREDNARTHTTDDRYLACS